MQKKFQIPCHKSAIRLHGGCFGLETRIIIDILSQNFWPVLATQETLTDLHGNKAISKWWTQKNWDFQDLQFSKIFSENFRDCTGPCVSRIDWCDGHWCGSTYMVVSKHARVLACLVVRLSNVTCKKCLFCVLRLFLSLLQTASWPYRLSHINAVCINQSC